MILYKKVFPFGKGVSFSHYIKALEEKNFSPYTLLIEKIPETENYHIEIVLTDITAQWRFGSIFTLISECIVQYSKGSREFILRASVESKHSFFAVGAVITALCGLSGILFIMITRNASVENVFTGLIVMTAGLAPLITTYIRDQNRLERIGSLASELNKK